MHLILHNRVCGVCMHCKEWFQVDERRHNATILSFALNNDSFSKADCGYQLNERTYCIDQPYKKESNANVISLLILLSKEVF